MTQETGTENNILREMMLHSHFASSLHNTLFSQSHYAPYLPTLNTCLLPIPCLSRRLQTDEQASILTFEVTRISPLWQVYKHG
ncbi:hypothetical protein E2C01_017116 [Portunus trituberculatus]|uniref:Uncharacterized protein n=1 Tax=Portunus trituberculatus TaxID=210409 RepID=A0A5B7DSY3_PORTR|nr:hypothetical protein [Portunus trituberculatus]